MTHPLLKNPLALVLALAAAALPDTSTAWAETISPQPGWSFDMESQVSGVEVDGPFLINAFPFVEVGVEAATLRVVRQSDVDALMDNGAHRFDALTTAPEVAGTLEMWRDDQLLAWHPSEPLDYATRYAVLVELRTEDSFHLIDLHTDIAFETLAEGRTGQLPALSQVELELEPRADGCNQVVASFRLRHGAPPSPYLELSSDASLGRATTVSGSGFPLIVEQTYSTRQESYCVALTTRHFLSGETASINLCAEHDAALDAAGPFCTPDYQEPPETIAEGCSGAGTLPASLLIAAAAAVLLARRRRTLADAQA